MGSLGKRLIIFLLLIGGVVPVVTSIPIYPGNLTAHFIDVGQGDAIFLITPANNTILIDAGPNTTMGAKVSQYIQESGLNLDAIIATHSDADEIGGMQSVLATFTPQAFIDSPYPTVPWTATYSAIMNTINQSQIPYYTIHSGSNILSYQGLNISILNPQAVPFADTNDNSIVFRLQYGSVAFLFMGDAEKLAEDAIMQNSTDLRTNILKVGHHGSDTSSQPSFLARVDPAIAVIEVGTNNQYHFPKTVTLDNLKTAGATIYRTDLDGTVVITTNGAAYSIVIPGLKIVPGGFNLPTDPDRDGLYEDVNGNGRIDFNDVVIFFKNLEWIGQNEPFNRFDFNSNGRIDFNDIVILFKEV